jgi:hypothetical protein
MRRFFSSAKPSKPSHDGKNISRKARQVRKEKPKAGVLKTKA